MTRKVQGGYWVLECDWVDPNTGAQCTYGRDNEGKPNGQPRIVFDPDRGQAPDKHFQCGRHHGIIPQAERPEFQVPAGSDTEEKENVIKPNG